MKNRSSLTIFTTILSVLACFGLLSGAQAADGDLGGGNTNEGFRALNSLTTGGFNTGLGWYSLFSNSDAFYNTGVGAGALVLNDGDSNTAVGAAALLLNTSGTENTAVGTNALVHNVDGHENTAVGAGAGPNLVTGFNNTYLGDFVGSLAGTPDESSTIRIGDLSNGNGSGSLACFIGGIFNNFQPVGGSVVEVTLDLATDELGWDIGPNQRGGAPAAPRSAPGRRAPGAPAQRPALPNGKVGRVEKLEATVAQQQKQIEVLTTQLKEQAAQIQKVSAQVEVSKPATKVANNQ